MGAVIYNKDSVFRFSNVKRFGSAMHSHHYHSFFEIYYLISGKCNFFIDDKTYEVKEGDLVLIPDGVIHKTNYGMEEHSRIVVECSGGFIPEGIREKICDMPRLFRNSDVTGDLREIFEKIEREQQTNDEFTLDSLYALMKLLFYTVARNENEAEVAAPKNRMVENVTAHIKTHYSSDISLSEMAKENFVSPEHLSRTFKRETGFGFNEFITLVRLQHAEKMLREKSTKRISEIAYSCGFNDSNYFSDKFKKVYGISPLAFSKKCK